MSCSSKNKNKKKTRRDGVIPIHFLRIVLGDDVNFHMPKQFVRKYGNGLSESVLIQAPTGPLWKVELERGDDQIWFGNGWQEFVDYFSLKTGSSLVFRYEGHSRFNVLFIFDPDALETKHLKDTSSVEDARIPKVEDIESDHDSAGMMSNTPACKGKRIEDVVEIESDDDSDGIAGGDIPTLKKGKRTQEVVEIESDHDSAGIMRGHIPTYKRTGIQDKRNVQKSGKKGISPAKEASGGASASWRCRSFEAPRKIQSLAPKREARALRKDTNFQSERPFFKLTMKPSHFKRLELYIPVKFRRRYITGKTGDVILQNMDGRTWSVSYKEYEGAYSVWFYGGWKEFLLDNDLQVGDTCRFELQKGLKIRFIVTISRVVEDANHHFTAAQGSKTGHVGLKRCSKTGSQFESGCTIKSEGLSPPRTSKESNVPRKKIKTEHGMFPLVMRGDKGAGCCIRRLWSEGTGRAFERASKLKSNHPLFSVVITTSFLQKSTKSTPTVPRCFCEEYLKPISQDVMLQMKDKLWSLRLSANSARLGRFGVGWHTFALESNLQPGDVCVFQMVNANPIVFKVTIFSGSSG